ncbi:MAG TPA: phosphotransferase [Verrucomicrobiae bacterium]|jgi:5-methylthioribose kinase
MLELSLENAEAHARSRGWLAPDENAKVTLLGGGVSNIVLKVTSAQQNFVIKQALPKLRVAMDWQARIDRIFIERDALKELHAILPAGTVPAVLYEDPQNYLFAMTAAPDDAKNWKTELMAGRVEPWVAEEAGWMLGEIHRRFQADERVRARFADSTNFIELRADPYFVTVGRHHPDLKPIVDAEIKALLETKWTLVHGDYSPKNILIRADVAATEDRERDPSIRPRRGRPQPRLFLIDCEVAHLGHPAFDAAFCLNHFCLKSVHFAQRKNAYLELARHFWRTYTANFATPRFDELSQRTVMQLGLLQLARVDGKSPAEYLTDSDKKEKVRRIGRMLLSKRPSRVEKAIDWIEVEQ